MLFVEKDRQRPKQREQASRGLSDRAVILILGSIPTIVLAVFDLPVIPRQFQQSLRAGLRRPKTGPLVSDFFGVFDDLATPHRVHLALEAQELRRAGQAQGLRLGLANPQRPLFNSSVAFVGRAGGRGEAPDRSGWALARACG